MPIVLLVAVATLLSYAGVAQETAKKQPTMVTTTFTVYGNCGKCKKNIERPFKEMQGVENATWNKKTKQFTITYDPPYSPSDESRKSSPSRATIATTSKQAMKRTRSFPSAAAIATVVPTMITKPDASDSTNSQRFVACGDALGQRGHCR